MPTGKRTILPFHYNRYIYILMYVIMIIKDQLICSINDIDSVISFLTCALCCIASLVRKPCFKAFLFPLGAPVDLPPCQWHFPFFIAGCLHLAPVCLAVAEHRGS